MEELTQVVAEAEQEAAEAQALIDALEERVRDGDESVTPEQLETARRLVEFAKLRVEAAERKSRAAVVQAASDELADAVAGANALIDAPEGPVPALEAKAVKAFAAYADAVYAQWAEARAVARRLAAANRKARSLGIPSSREAHGLYLENSTLRVDGDPARRATVAFVSPESIVDSVIRPGGLGLTRSARIEVAPSRQVADERLPVEDRTSD